METFYDNVNNKMLLLKYITLIFIVFNLTETMDALVIYYSKVQKCHISYLECNIVSMTIKANAIVHCYMLQTLVDAL